MVTTYIMTGLVEILAALVLFFMIMQNDILDTGSRRRFLLPIGATAAVVAAEVVTSVIESGGYAFAVPDAIFNVVGFSLSPLIPVLIARAFHNKAYRAGELLVIPAAVNIVLAVLSPWFGFIFEISNATYQRGPLFMVYVISYVCGILLLLIETYRAIKHYQNKNRGTLALLFLFVIIGTSIQLWIPEVHTTWMCVMIAIGLYYAYFCEMNEKLDALTDLFNRKVYECELLRLEKTERAVIVNFDVDDFKGVNDKYGHQYGDLCLSIISNNIKQAFFGVGVCYRIGGDEFCVVGTRSRLSAADEASEVFVRKMEEYRQSDPRMPMVSVGTAMYEKGKSTVYEAIGRADEQMYIYKNMRKKYDCAGETADE